MHVRRLLHADDADEDEDVFAGFGRGSDAEPSDEDEGGSQQEADGSDGDAGPSAAQNGRQAGQVSAIDHQTPKCES